MPRKGILPMGWVEFWRMVPPLALIAMISGAAFWYVKTIVKSAIQDLKEEMNKSFTLLDKNINTLDKNINDKITELEKNDIKGDAVNIKIADINDRVKNNVEDINTRLKESTIYAHTARHELGNRLQSHEIQLSEQAAMLRMIMTRMDRLDKIPDLIEAKLVQILQDRK